MTTKIQEAIFTALGTYSALNALVGARIYPDLAPQDSIRPFVVWQEVSTLQANDMGGSVETGGLTNYRIQITSWAEGPKGASKVRDIDAKVRLAMIAATAFKSLLVDSRAMPFENDTKLFGTQSDFSVWLKT